MIKIDQQKNGKKRVADDKTISKNKPTVMLRKPKSSINESILQTLTQTHRNQMNTWSQTPTNYTEQNKTHSMKVLFYIILSNIISFHHSFIQISMRKGRTKKGP